MSTAKILATSLILLALMLPTIQTPATVRASENSLAGETYWYTFNFTISGQMGGVSINLYIVTNVTMEFGEDSVTITYNVKETNMPFGPPTSQETYTYSYDDLFSEAAMNPGGDTNLMDEDMGSVNIVYKGMTSWHGYPAIKYEFSASSGNETATGELYIHAGIPVPLYMKVEAQSPQLSGNGEYEVIDSNLPKESAAKSYDAGNYQIHVVAPKGADITVEGEKGSNTLTVSNKGTAPGWVVVEKKAASMAAAESNTNLVTTIAVMPGETKTLQLPTPIQSNPQETSGGGGGGGSMMVWAILAIAAIAVIAGLAYKLASKPKTMTAETTPSPPEAPEATW